MVVCSAAAEALVPAAVVQAGRVALAGIPAAAVYLAGEEIAIRTAQAVEIVRVEVQEAVACSEAEVVVQAVQVARAVQVVLAEVQEAVCLEAGKTEIPALITIQELRGHIHRRRQGRDAPCGDVLNLYLCPCLCHIIQDPRLEKQRARGAVCGWFWRLFLSFVSLHRCCQTAL